MTNKTSKQDLENRLLVGIPIELSKQFSVTGDIDEINTALEELEKYQPMTDEQIVIHFIVCQGLGTIERHHQILLKKSADSRQTHDHNEQYVSLDYLLRRKQEIMQGKYIIRNKKAIGLNPCNP